MVNTYYNKNNSYLLYLIYSSIINSFFSLYVGIDKVANLLVKKRFESDDDDDFDSEDY